ncbi:MAG: hypothetical protein EB068_00320 [Betaproteobacteria bacterium]|nr:hypothetical protein [Betaproteobacteria bacterium]
MSLRGSAAEPQPRRASSSLGEVPEAKPFAQRLASLLRVDCVRTSRLLETAQYAALYTCLCLPVGIGIDKLFELLYPKVEEGRRLTTRQLLATVGVALLQVIMSAVSMLYIRKMADLVPFFFNLCPERYVAHYHVDEVFGEAAIALIFVGVQTSLIGALDRIRRCFSTRPQEAAAP